MQGKSAAVEPLHQTGSTRFCKRHQPGDREGSTVLPWQISGIAHNYRGHGELETGASSAGSARRDEKREVAINRFGRRLADHIPLGAMVAVASRTRDKRARATAETARLGVNLVQA